MMQYALMVAHWAACIFYFIARQSNFTLSTWVGNTESLFAGKPNMIRQAPHICNISHLCTCSPFLLFPWRRRSLLFLTPRLSLSCPDDAVPLLAVLVHLSFAFAGLLVLCAAAAAADFTSLDMLGFNLARDEHCQVCFWQYVVKGSIAKLS